MNNGKPIVLATFEDIQFELKDRIVKADDTWAKSLYKKSVNSERVNNIKAQLDMDCGRFDDVPEDANTKSELYAPLFKLLNSIIGASGNSKSRNGTRQAVSTKGKQLHKCVVESQVSPDIVIKATGSSFELPRAYRVPNVDAHVGYTNITTAIELRLDSTTNDVERTATKEVQRMCISAKEIFFQQPNRLFLYTLAVTEERVRLIQFDRAGALYSPLFNYHDDPDTFIRIVVGLSSMDEAELGLDTSVQFQVIGDMKALGTIRVLDPKTNEFTNYKMRSVDPFLRREELFGRGTRMWDVEDADGTRLYVKDAWIDPNLTPEYIILLKAKGVKGVQQIVDYEDRLGHPYGEIRYFRPRCDPDYFPFVNKCFQRLVTVRYGVGITTRNKTEAEVLSALYEAIKAHERLLDRGILHCDISLGNILFGGPSAPDGLAGILIDLDLAIKAEYDKHPIDGRTTGTRHSHSNLQLKGRGRPCKPAHDYLDDLESFFWVLIHLIYDQVNHDLTWAHHLINTRGHGDQEESAEAKRAFLAGDLEPSIIPEGWSKRCKTLVVAFHDFIDNIVSEKEEIVGEMERAWDFSAMQALHSQKRAHYQEVLEIFEAALPAHRAPLARASRHNA
ncbi:hypothetical protein DFP72DRAFT_1067892 [Ephemerocybe angulata]|uniref:Fungal-type protein kinase domain-containing protein n=1 Tax=Ephemerocybe angulata TaxID=980116 RepID=A0A8H6HZI5_9AGAR|nr:hypothetical protein DFP72DRAFT_1067892 [Tulosesus angulatus]